MSSSKCDKIQNDCLVEKDKTRHHHDAQLGSSFLQDPGLEYEMNLADFVYHIKDSSTVIKEKDSGFICQYVMDLNGSYWIILYTVSSYCILLYLVGFHWILLHSTRSY